MSKIVTASLLGLVLLASCDSQLDLKPMGELTSETFYNTEEDFEAASLAPYSTLLNLYFDQFGNPWFQTVMYPSDDVRHPQGSNDLVEFNWLPTNGGFAGLWSEAYKGIMRANVILNRLPEASGFTGDVAAKKARFEAEAKYIRAYFYFILARNYGNVPIIDELVTSLADSRVGNSEPGEVWDLIEADLAFARDNLPEQWGDNNVGRATSFAASALLGKVRLFRAQWFDEPAKYQGAIEEFDRIFDSGQFELVADWRNNFQIATENNEESLFEIQMTRGDFNPWLPTDFGLEQNQNVGAAGSGRKVFTGASCHLGECAPGANAYGYGQVHITEPLQNEFEANDPRRPWTFFADGDMYTADTTFHAEWSVTGATPAKYIKPFDPTGFPPNITTNNERIIRYADVLLMLAEAELLGNNNVARAADLINRVRERARDFYEVVNGTAAPAGTLPDRSANVSVDQMFEWLMHERRVELALEVHRYDDLVRWHRAGLIDISQDVDFGSTVANNAWSEKHLLKPIPQQEIDNNPDLQQNPGY